MNTSRILIITITLSSCMAITSSAQADELLLQIEKSLASLGYETGPVDGKETLETTISISKFQSQNDLAVTGEPSPQLAGILRAKASDGGVAAVSSVTAPKTSADDATVLADAQQACLQKAAAKAEEERKNAKKSGSFGRLMGSISRTARRFGLDDITDLTRDVYDANATAQDVEVIAEELGITEDDVIRCQQP